MMEISKIEKMYMTGFDADGQEIVIEIVPMKYTVSQININVDTSENDIPRKTIFIETEFEEIRISAVEKTIDPDELLQILAEGEL